MTSTTDTGSMNRPSPKVFISYSWSSPKHEEWVVDLAEKLSADGIHVVLDKWDLREGQDKYVFMERMVTDAEVVKVLIICDRPYSEKADVRKGGVGTESQIISPEVYSQVDQEKFIPIVVEFDEHGDPYLPTYLKGRIYVDLSTDDRFAQGYERLLRNIFNRPALKRPPIGAPPSYLTEDALPRLNTGHHFARFKEAITNSRPHARPSAIDYLDVLVRTHDDFVVTEDERPMDEVVLAHIEAFKPYRDEFVEFVRLCCRYGADPVYFEAIIKFFERVLPYHYPQKDVRQYNVLSFDQYRFVHWELFIYLIATLIKEQAFDAIDLFLEEQYFYSTNTEKRSGRFTVFDSYIRSLDEFRKQRLKLNRISVASDVIRDRADNPAISFDEIMQADLILGVRSVLRDGGDYWYPRTLVYAERWDTSGFEIFFRAQSRRNLEVIKRLFRVSSKEELLQCFADAQSKRGVNRWNFDGWPIPLAGYMNLANLDTT